MYLTFVKIQLVELQPASHKSIALYTAIISLLKFYLHQFW